jgi:hypothetical protein
MYSPGRIFRWAYPYAKLLGYPIYILSAKYGLLNENALIDTYNISMKDLKKDEKHRWAENVISCLKEEFDIANTNFIILAGNDYFNPIKNHLKHYERPLENVNMFYQPRELKALIKKLEETESEYENSKQPTYSPPIPSRTTNNMCYDIHNLFNQMPRYRWKDIKNIPFENGIYIMFEEGEKYHEMDRIVRVGTHEADGRLRRRLKDHFVSKNKDGSIFRKNIGKTILNKDNHPYLAIWSDNSSKKATMYDKYGDAFDLDFQKRIETEVSEYLQNNISFTCFPVPTKELRLRYEEGIIATLHQSQDFGPSNKWYGKYSPISAIKDSGLWLVEGLSGTPLSEKEFSRLMNIPNESLAPEEYTSHPTSNSKNTKQPDGIADITEYLRNKLIEAAESGKKTITIQSGKLHKELGLSNRMPSVCNAMYKLMRDDDRIIEQPPKKRGSRVIIEYNLSNQYKLQKIKNQSKSIELDADNSARLNLTLHEAMRLVLSETKDNQMHATNLANEIYQRGLYLKRDGTKAKANQIRARAKNYNMFEILPGSIIKLNAET